MCQPRLWYDIGFDKKHKRFLSSSIYKQFREANDGKTISKTVFRESVCICIKDLSDSDGEDDNDEEPEETEGGDTIGGRRNQSSNTDG